MNHVTLMGRLTRDPEMSYLQSGKAFSKFTVAVSREFNREEADFINCTAWGKTAETIAEYLRKGRRIALQGRISVSSYEQNGEKRRATRVVVNSFEFVESAGNSSNSGGYQQHQPFKNNNSKPPVQNETFENDNDDMDDDEEFPF